MSSPYFNETLQAATPPPKKTPWGWIIGGCGVAGLLGVLLCCGGFGALGMFGVKALAQNVQKQVQSEPEIQEHIGEIQSISINFIRSGEVEGNKQVFDLQGTKGNGELIVDPLDGDKVRSAVLRLPDGTEVQVLP